MSYYSSGASTFRKDQQLSSRYRQKEQVPLYSRYANKNQQNPLRHQLSSTVRNIIPSQRQTVLQQEQINDLQRKIDLILMHNEKLQSQKQRYRLLYEQSKAQIDFLRAQKQQLRVQFEHLRAQTNERAYHSKTARFVSEENSFVIQKLRKELQLTAKSYEQKLSDAFESKRVMKEEIQTLTKIIEDINRQNKQLKLSIKEQSLKVESLTFQLKEEFIRQQAELENKLRDEFLIREIELKNEKKQVMETYEEQIKEIKELVQRQKEEIHANKQKEVNRLVQDFEEQKRDLIRHMKEEKEREIQILLSKHRQDIKREQDKAIDYINQNINNIQQKDEMMKLEYEEEINRLRDSLQKRKLLIDSLISNATQNNQINQNIEHNHQHIQESQQQRDQQQQQHEQQKSSIYKHNSQLQLSWLPQLFTMKDQLQQQTTQYLQQSQLLKLKLTEKFHTDISSLKHVYENKIELISLHNDQLQQENNRLRTIYENSLQQNIKNKKQFELEKSKLKNIIRKLNIQLHGIQEEFKLNIEGVRSMNNTFSMTMMKSMIEVKQKANFFSEENRKLRKAYEDHENQLMESQRLNDQKLSYYEQKYQTQKEKSARTISDLKNQLQLSQQEAQERESQLRDNLNKQHEMIHELVSQLRKDLQKLQIQNQQLKKQNNHLSVTLKDRDQQITHLKSLINELQADVQKLKLDLSMAGVQDQNHTDTINQWKNHYQTTISQLNQQIQILQSKLNTKHQQLTQIVKKYQLLESNMNKVIKSMNKKSQLENKVLEVGLDNNLVNNLAQLFGKQQKENILPMREN